MKRFAAIALTIIAALVTSSFATIRSSKASTNPDTSITTTHEGTAEVQSESLPRALTPDRAKFQPKYVACAVSPNFSQPARKAPIRRKGRVQH